MDINYKIRKALKYLIHAIVLFITIKCISMDNEMKNWENIIKITIIGSISFAILDMYAPTFNYNNA